MAISSLSNSSQQSSALTSNENTNELPPPTDLTMDEILDIPEMRDLFILGIVTVNLGINGMAIDMVRRTLDDNE